MQLLFMIDYEQVQQYKSPWFPVIAYKYPH